jgi:TrkA domain protein
MDVECTALPGIGSRHMFTTAGDHRVGVVVHHGGRRDLVIHERDDPDATTAIALTKQEASVLAGLLRIREVIAGD